MCSFGFLLTHSLKAPNIKLASEMKMNVCKHQDLFWGGELSSYPSSTGALSLLGSCTGWFRTEVAPTTVSHVLGCKQQWEGSVLLVQTPVSPVLSADGFSQEWGSSCLLCPPPCASPGPCVCCCSLALPHQPVVGSNSVHTIFQCSAPNCPLLTAESCPAHGGCAQAGAGWCFKLSPLLIPCPGTGWDLGDHPSPPPQGTPPLRGCWPCRGLALG